jgi:hypothetical protein
MKSKVKSPVQQTIDDGKRWWRLVQRYAKLEAADKLSSIVGALVLGAILLVFVLIAIGCLSIFAAHRLTVLTGDLALSYALVGVGWLLLCVLVLLVRKALIVRPLQKKFQHSFFKDERMKHGLEVEKLKTQYQLQLLQERMKDKARMTMSGSSDDDKNGSKIGRYVSYGITAYKTYRTLSKLRKMLKKKKNR